MKLKLKSIDLNNEFLIQRTAFLMEISSAEINTNSSKYLLQPNALKQAIADILEIDSNSIELPLFEAIKVSTESNCQNKKVFRCYGLKIYFAVNTVTMSRRVVLMKLEKSVEDDTMVNKLVNAWNLEQEPSIDDVVMVYDLSGDLVIQRPIEEPRYSHYKRTNLELMNKAEEMDLITQQKWDEEAPEPEISISLDMNHPIEVSLTNDERTRRRIKRRTSSKMHFADTSSLFDGMGLYGMHCPDTSSIAFDMQLPGKYGRRGMHVADTSSIGLEMQLQGLHIADASSMVFDGYNNDDNQSLEMQLQGLHI